MTPFDDVMARIEDAIDVEDYLGAREIHAGLRPVTAQEHWRTEVMHAYLMQPMDEDPAWEMPIDELCVLKLKLARDDRAVPEETARVFVNSLTIHIARRRHTFALAQLDEWERVNGASGRTIAMRGQVLLAMDEREQARALLTPAAGAHATQHVEAQLAQLHYAVADFDEAERYARQLDRGRFRLEGLETLAAVAASRGDHQAEYDALTEAITLAPNSRSLSQRLARRALCAASLDRLADARSDFEAALASVPSRWRPAAASYVRHRLDALEAAAAGARHARLKAFPSIVQKWNYCGPAVIELCLRYAGVEMTQDLIAEAVKNPSGTPVYKIVEFLRDQGFEVRRVEASSDGVRAAVDAGVPLILESTYSNSSHVSVAIGYDDRIGVLIVADPMTHAPSLESLEGRGEVARGLRFGAVAVLGRATEVTQATRDALDNAGLVESALISRFDDIGRDYGGFSHAFSHTTALEAAGIAEEVLTQEPDFEAAAIAYAGALQQAADDENSHIDAGTAITAMRSRYPHEVAFASLAAQWYTSESTPLAVADAVVGAALDPGASAPRNIAAYSLGELGERGVAYRYANDALLRAPHDAGATIDLAVIAMRERLERAREAGTLGAFGAASLVMAMESTVPWEISDEELETLSTWLAAAAVDMAPGNGAGHVAIGDHAALAGDWAAACDAYREAVEVSGTWVAARLRLAFALEVLDPAEARVQLRAIIDQAQLSDSLSTAVVGLAGRLGDLDLAGVATLASLDTRVGGTSTLQALFDATLAITRSEPAAARAVVALAAQRPGNEEILHSTVTVLEDSNVRGVAARVLRDYLQHVPNDARAQFRLARIIARTPAERDEAISLLERARELAPWAEVLTVDLGWLLLDSETARVQSMVDALDGGSLGALELARTVAQRVGHARDEEAADAKLVAMCGSPFYARLAAARYHLDQDRVAEAMAIGLAGAPHATDLDAVANMMHVLCHSGREAYAVQYASENVEVVENRAVARTIAFAGDAAHAEVVARAARVTADANRSGPWAATFAVQALCMEGRFDEAVERAQGDARGLARCVEWTIDHRARLDLAHRAIELAPEDRTALAAWHAVLMDAGRVDEARNAAHVLMDNFPYEHQAAERLAEVELFAGDVDAAVTWAQTAVAEDPQCARALAALTMASVAAGDWEAAKTALLRYGAVSRPLRLFADAEPVGLVDAAIGRDREVYERRLAAVRKVAPGLPLDRITSACEERFNEAEKP